MLQEFLTINIFGFLLIFMRVGTSFMLLPGFSSPSVSTQIRLFVALGVSFVMTPILSGGLPRVPATALEITLLATSEVLIGAFMGVLGRLMVGAIQVAGTTIALISSLANALIQDPIADQQSSVVSNFLSTMAMVLIFATNLHYLMIQALVESYTAFVPGQPLPLGDITDHLARQLGLSFKIGLQLAAPLIITSVLYNVGLGVLGRLMPLLPLFLFGMPFQIAAQIWILMISLSTMMMVFLKNFDEGYRAFLSL